MGTNNNKKSDKRPSFFAVLLSNLFGGKKKLSIYEEAQIQSPMKTIIKTFSGSRIAMAALFIWLMIFTTVLVGPYFNPINLSYSETSQLNVAPGFDMMDVPKVLQGNAKKIAVGPTFSVGLSNDGQVYTWGKTRVTNVIDMKDIPTDIGKVVDIAVGFDHAIALTEDGKIVGWGSNRQQQITQPYELEFVKNIKEIYAGYQCSVVLTEDGYSIFFGNDRNNDYIDFHPYQYKLQKIALTADAVMGLTFDGEVVSLGNQQNSYVRIPENMGKVVDISATASTVAAVNEDGKVFVWGNISVETGEGNVPEVDGKIVKIEGGRYHYTAVTDTDKIVSWGSNVLKQTEIPTNISSIEVKDLFVGFYQNYILTDTDEVKTFGHKGYLMGTDDLGRDLFNRLLNGGRMTMTIGAVAVFISTFIGVVVGSISGYFGGRIDMFFQRISEMISSLPFLPFAMILSAFIGNSMAPNQKIFLIMVILGVLSWPPLQRLVRAQVLSVREQEYVTAARAVGINQFTIVFKHILPNVISVIIVSATLSFGSSMLTEASLSYLGFGVQQPQPTWGNMLFGANNSIVIQNYWWRWVFASIALGACVICINLIGEGLRDAIDPKSQER